MSDKKRILEEIARRKVRIKNLDWTSLMFDKQREFIEDPSRLKVAVCSRRAGKSHGTALALLKAGFEHPGSFPIYCNANRASAKVIIWPALREIDEKLGLGLEFIESTSDVRLPNRSVIKIYGIGSRREIDKARGGKPPIAVIDEAQNMGSDLNYLVSQVLLPATADYKAPILITGTPSSACAGPFYEIAHGHSLSEDSNLEWSVHHWTAADNPHIKNIEEEYDLACAANGWTRQSPGFLREMQGIWARDTEGTAFVNEKNMVVDHFPMELADDWRFILGVDLGTVDPCAFTILANSRQLGVTYVLESWSGEYSTLGAGTEIHRIYEDYPIKGPAIVDSGGQGAAFVKQWQETHPTLPIKPVKKGFNSVDMSIGIINADIRAGKLFFVRKGCQQLLDEMRILVWDDKMSATGSRRIKRGAGYPDHCADSFRYAFQGVPKVGHNFGLVPPEKGSPAWYRQMMDKHRSDIMGESDNVDKPWWAQTVSL